MFSPSESRMTLTQRIESRIRQSTYGRIWDLHVEEVQGCVVVRGNVPSHHTKQLALHGAGAARRSTAQRGNHGRLRHVGTRSLRHVFGAGSLTLTFPVLELAAPRNSRDTCAKAASAFGSDALRSGCRLDREGAHDADARERPR